MGPGSPRGTCNPLQSPSSHSNDIWFVFVLDSYILFLPCGFKAYPESSSIGTLFLPGFWARETHRWEHRAPGTLRSSLRVRGADMPSMGPELLKHCVIGGRDFTRNVGGLLGYQVRGQLNTPSQGSSSSAHKHVLLISLQSLATFAQLPPWSPTFPCCTSLPCSQNETWSHRDRFIPPAPPRLISVLNISS